MLTLLTKAIHLDMHTHQHCHHHCYHHHHACKWSRFITHTSAYCADITSRAIHLDMHTLHPHHNGHHHSCHHHHASQPHSIMRCIGHACGLLDTCIRYACGSWDTCIGYACRHRTCRHAQLVSNVCPFFLFPSRDRSYGEFGPFHGCCCYYYYRVVIIILLTTYRGY